MKIERKAEIQREIDDMVIRLKNIEAELKEAGVDHSGTHCIGYGREQLDYATVEDRFK